MMEQWEDRHEDAIEASRVEANNRALIKAAVVRQGHEDAMEQQRAVMAAALHSAQQEHAGQVGISMCSEVGR